MLRCRGHKTLGKDDPYTLMRVLHTQACACGGRVRQATRMTNRHTSKGRVAGVEQWRQGTMMATVAATRVSRCGNKSKQQSQRQSLGRPLVHCLTFTPTSAPAPAPTPSLHAFFVIRGGEGGGEILEEAGTFSGQALLLSYPYPGGGGGSSQGGRHPLTALSTVPTQYQTTRNASSRCPSKNLSLAQPANTSALITRAPDSNRRLVEYTCSAVPLGY